MKILWRLILAVGTGLIVSGLCLDMVAGGRATDYATYPQTQTRRTFEIIAPLIENYRRKNGVLPTSLAILDTNPSLVLDGWVRPIIYQRSGTTYRLISYGSNGKVGGSGLDCDLSSDNPKPPESRMSRLDNLRHPLSRGMIKAAMICGALVALISFLTIKDESLERKNWIGLAVALVVLVIATGFVSLFITMLHVPSGH